MIQLVRQYALCLWYTSITICLLAARPGVSIGAETTNRKPPRKPLVPVVYIPPKPQHPQPGIRTAQGGTRGQSQALPAITLLIPDADPILTARAQPGLYWHLSAATDKPLLVTITTYDIEPLLEYTQSGVKTAGIHGLNLAEHSVRLIPEQEYEWSVTIQASDQPKSSDPIARGTILWPEATVQQTWQAALTDSAPVAGSAWFAQHGYWYDALTELMTEGLSAERQQLLDQVGLSQLSP